MEKYSKVLSFDSMKDSIKNAKYAVRGPIVIKSQEIEEKIKNGDKSYPFTKISKLNVGNPQAMGQPPITFHRQVLACLMDNSLLKSDFYHKDVINRANYYVERIANIGAYAESQGYKFVRENVAKFIEKRDGAPSKASDIYLANGASACVNMIILCLISQKIDGIMIAVPRYPLYTADITIKEGTIIPYFLDEENKWALSITSLEKSYEQAVSEGVKPKAIVVINPGNPTGAMLTIENIQSIIKFAFEKRLVIIADEVYQKNVYDDSLKFFSFKKVLNELGSPYKENQELFSLHSISKGVLGECGFRGGYMECVNLEEKVHGELLKLLSMNLGSSTVGEISVDLMVNPPTLENCSKETVEFYNNEIKALEDSLKARAKIVSTALSKMKNITINEIKGSMYALPRIIFSDKVKEEAEKEGKTPDEFFCYKCLNETGILVIPGNGFGQVLGTHHFRLTTLIYPDQTMEKCMETLTKFNEAFHQRYN